MRALLQRVSRGEVRVEERLVGRIGHGLVDALVDSHPLERDGHDAEDVPGRQAEGADEPPTGAPRESFADVAAPVAPVYPPMPGTPWGPPPAPVVDEVAQVPAPSPWGPPPAPVVDESAPVVDEVAPVVDEVAPPVPGASPWDPPAV